MTRPTNNIEAQILGLHEGSTPEEVEAAYKAYTERMAPRGDPLRDVQKALLLAMAHGMDRRKLEGFFEKKEEIERRRAPAIQNISPRHAGTQVIQSRIHEGDITAKIRGEMGHTLIIDDPWEPRPAQTPEQREATLRWFCEKMPERPGAKVYTAGPFRVSMPLTQYPDGTPFAWPSLPMGDDPFRFLGTGHLPMTLAAAHDVIDEQGPICKTSP